MLFYDGTWSKFNVYIHLYIIPWNVSHGYSPPVCTFFFEIYSLLFRPIGFVLSFLSSLVSFLLLSVFPKHIIKQKLKYPIVALFVVLKKVLPIIWPCNEFGSRLHPPCWSWHADMLFTLNHFDRQQPCFLSRSVLINSKPPRFAMRWTSIKLIW